MGIKSRQKRERKTRSKEVLLSFTDEQTRVREQQYNQNTSEKLIQKYDSELKRMRIETIQERRERVLGQNMEIKAKAAMETTIRAREINESNRERPVVVTSSSIVPDTQKEHPLWRNLVLIVLLFSYSCLFIGKRE